MFWPLHRLALRVTLQLAGSSDKANIAEGHRPEIGDHVDETERTAERARKLAPLGHGNSGHVTEVSRDDDVFDRDHGTRISAMRARPMQNPSGAKRL